ncbi:hypothetical protein F751_3230 [Auxenochlorella protothecoides]|uniref:U2A'/phosphoprotein 32 family A C-terminal domain-containing protein n=1 Tax=Auxenochlorella protothecoides TaxID=3075 RepID=A0A087SFK8_AUXPR|nr:hypothetical protein F751_3230 [Auxenochlorella protothecoides]KFM24512.1 hypothetical protein F751_3230 [Auxenochlorella protothecoides]
MRPGEPACHRKELLSRLKGRIRPRVGPPLTLAAVLEAGRPAWDGRKLSAVDCGIGAVGTVPPEYIHATTLYLSKNLLQSLEGIQAFRGLRALSLGDNPLSTLDSLRPLAALPHLESLHLDGCPVASLPYARAHLVATLPSTLASLNGAAVTPVERSAAPALLATEARLLGLARRGARGAHALRRVLLLTRLHAELRAELGVRCAAVASGTARPPDPGRLLRLWASGAEPAPTAQESAALDAALRREAQRAHRAAGGRDCAADWRAAYARVLAAQQAAAAQLAEGLEREAHDAAARGATSTRPPSPRKAHELEREAAAGAAQRWEREALVRELRDRLGRPSGVEGSGGSGAVSSQKLPPGLAREAEGRAEESGEVWSIAAARRRPGCDAMAREGQESHGAASGDQARSPAPGGTEACPERWIQNPLGKGGGLPCSTGSRSAAALGPRDSQPSHTANTDAARESTGRACREPCPLPQPWRSTYYAMQTGAPHECDDQGTEMEEGFVTIALARRGQQEAEAHSRELLGRVALLQSALKRATTDASVAERLSLDAAQRHRAEVAVLKSTIQGLRQALETSAPPVRVVIRVDQSEELEAEMAACRALRALCDDLEKELGSRQQSTGRELASAALARQALARRCLLTWRWRARRVGMLRLLGYQATALGEQRRLAALLAGWKAAVRREAACRRLRSARGAWLLAAAWRAWRLRQRQTRVLAELEAGARRHAEAALARRAARAWQALCMDERQLAPEDLPPDLAAEVARRSVRAVARHAYQRWRQAGEEALVIWERKDARRVRLALLTWRGEALRDAATRARLELEGSRAQLTQAAWALQHSRMEGGELAREVAEAGAREEAARARVSEAGEALSAALQQVAELQERLAAAEVQEGRLWARTHSLETRLASGQEEASERERNGEEERRGLLARLTAAGERLWRAGSGVHERPGRRWRSRCQVEDLNAQLAASSAQLEECRKVLRERGRGDQATR